MSDPVNLRKSLTDTFGQDVAFTEAKDGDLIVTIKPELVTDVLTYLRKYEKSPFDYLRCLSGVDYGTGVAVVYHLRSIKTGASVVVKTSPLKENLTFASVTGLWAGADWPERETAEMFGIIFAGHPDPRKLLLKDDFGEYPLRKRFKLQDGD
ncbi:MAG: NADH-quinone oxidoreductase subunit C [Actinomycetota bacterium]